MGFFDKLKSGLEKTKRAFLGSVTDVIKSFRRIDEDLLEELEEAMICADMGAETASSVVDELRVKIKEEKLRDADEVIGALKEILCGYIGEGEPLKLDTKPSVILVIGVNGVGKTTSIGKIAAHLKSEGKSVLVAAADPFRGAAIDQLAVWCERAGVELIRQNEGSDPAAVVYDAAAAARKRNSDVLIIDTAGRLHNKKNLMNELAKIDRVIDRELPGVCRETLLVMDATTGQNAVSQAKEFMNSASITGLILTKLDGTAKGGAIFSIKKLLDIPVKYIGVGEQIGDMQPFDAQMFVDALFENVEKEEKGTAGETPESGEGDANE